MVSIRESIAVRRDALWRLEARGRRNRIWRIWPCCLTPWVCICEVMRVDFVFKAVRFACDYRSILARFAIEIGNLSASAIGKSIRCGQMRTIFTVSLEDVPLVGSFVFIVTSIGPRTSAVPRVLRGSTERTLRNAQIEVAEDELDGRQQQARKRYPQHFGNRSLGRGIPAQSICPWYADIVDLDGPRLGQTESDIIP